MLQNRNARPRIICSIADIERVYVPEQKCSCPTACRGGSHSTKLLLTVSYPAPNATKIVKDVIKNLTTDGMKANLKEFTGFTTRCKFFRHLTSFST